MQIVIYGGWFFESFHCNFLAEEDDTGHVATAEVRCGGESV